MEDLHLEVRNLGENNLEYERESLLSMLSSFKNEANREDWNWVRGQNFLPFQWLQEEESKSKNSKLSFDLQEDDNEETQKIGLDRQFQRELEALIEIINKTRPKKLNTQVLIQAQNKLRKHFQSDQDLEDDLQFLSQENDKLIASKDGLENQCKNLSLNNELEVFLNQTLGVDSGTSRQFLQLLQE